MDNRYANLIKLFSPITVLSLVLAILLIAALPFLLSQLFYVPFSISTTLQTPLYIVVGVVVLFMGLRAFLSYLEPMTLKISDFNVDLVELDKSHQDSPNVSEQIAEESNQTKEPNNTLILNKDSEIAHVISSLRKSIDQTLSNQILKSIDEEFAKRDLQNQKWERYITGFDEIRRRLYDETNNLARRSNINLALGSLTTVLAGIGLIIIVFYRPLELTGLSKDEYGWKIFSHYIPRLSFIIFAELFAYFFLKLYKSGLSDIKYYQNEISNVELKLIALKAALAVQDNEILKIVISDLSKTERNFILKKDESTIELERIKADNMNAKDWLEQITTLVKSKG